MLAYTYSRASSLSNRLWVSSASAKREAEEPSAPWNFLSSGNSDTSLSLSARQAWSDGYMAVRSHLNSSGILLRSRSCATDGKVDAANKSMAPGRFRVIRAKSKCIAKLLLQYRCAARLEKVAKTTRRLT